MKTFAGLINGTRYYFRVTAVDSGLNESMYSNEVNSALHVVLAAKDVPSGIPKEYSLTQNYPNPFNPSTVIRYGVPERSHVKLEIFNLLGQRVAMLVDGVQEAQYYQVTWTTARASGLYLYRIEATALDDPSKKFVQIRKMLFIK